MKKAIATLLCSMALIALSACSAADNSTITSPRMGNTINSYCTFYEKVSVSSTYTTYRCNDNGTMYKCSASGCEED